jgi:hypothetical protein
VFEIWRMRKQQYKAAYQLLKERGFVQGNHLTKQFGVSLGPVLYHLVLDQENPLRAVRIITDEHIYPWMYHKEDVKVVADWYLALPKAERDALYTEAQAAATGTINKALQSAPLLDFRTNPPTYFCAECRASGRACCSEHQGHGQA